MKATIAITLLLLPYSAFAQLTPVRNTPSPEIANLGTFGEIPVGLFTGQPEISIPLYSINLGNVSVPITATYNLSSVKPENQGGPLGLGWNLSAGGYITRTVRGVKDERMSSDSIAHGFYDNAEKMRGITEESFARHTENMTGMNAGEKWYELSADEFSFDFCGYKGNFYYTEDGWQVVSDYDIKVEFDEGNGFLKYPELRIYDSGWEYQDDDYRFFDKFSLVTPDGTRYDFGGGTATEYCISYYNRNNSELIPSTWKLTRITTTDNRIADFTYDVRELRSDIRYCPQKSVLYGNSVYLNNGRAGYIGFLHFSTLLSKISTGDTNVDFVYKRDNDYGYKFYMGALWWNDKKSADRMDAFLYSKESTAKQFMTFIPRVPTKTDYGSIINALCRKSLRGIHISDRNFDKSVYFSYQKGIGREKLDSIVFRRGIIDNKAIENEYIPPFDESEDDYSMQHYSFEYNNDITFNKKYEESCYDSWGYYNGKIEKISDYPSFSLSSPKLEFTKAETLKSITYPTGGKSEFEYELNEYGAKVSNDHTAVNECPNSISGGLRLRSVTNRDYDGSIISSKRYKYTKDYKETKSSGISKGEMLFSIEYNIQSLGLRLNLMSAGGFLSNTTSMNTPDVGYSTVITEDVDSLGNSLGYKKFQFTNFGTDINGVSHLDDKAWGSNVNSDKVYSCLPFTCKSAERGKILSEEVFDANGNKTEETSYRYSKTNKTDINTATQQAIIMYRSPTSTVVGLLGWLTKTPRYSYLCSKMTTKELYDNGKTYQTDKYFTYNSCNLLSTETTVNPNNEIEKAIRSYTYSCDKPGTEPFAGHGIKSAILEESFTANGMSDKYAYRYGTNVYGVPFVWQYLRIYNGGTDNIEYEVTKTDKFGNPIEFVTKGTPYVQIFSDDGTHVQLFVEDATLEQLCDAVGERLAYYISQCEYYNATGLIYNKRDKLTNMHMRFFNYLGSDLLFEETTKEGLRYSYIYDNSNHLIDKSLLYGNNKWQTLKMYEYNYRH